MTYDTEEQTCVSCGAVLMGRIDKRFCDADCRNTYHNQTQRQSEQKILSINRKLRRNRTILKTLCPQGKATVRRSVLKDLGFNFEVFSGLFPSGGNVYYFSYEYGFMPILQFSSNEKKEVQKVLIVQRQPYVQNTFDPWKFIKS